MKKAGVEIDVPFVLTPHLVDWLMDAGPVDYAGMDRVPLLWSTIADWSAMTKIVPAPWEARLLRRLSAEWLGESRRAEKPDCPAPTADEATIQSRRKLVERKLAAMFG
jgi:hypothetical protein